MELLRIAYGAGIGALYSVLNWSRKRADRRREDVKDIHSFGARRLIVHMVAGAIAGVILSMGGDDLNPESIGMVVTNMGLVPLIENVGLVILYVIDQQVYNFVPEKKEDSFFR